MEVVEAFPFIEPLFQVDIPFVGEQLVERFCQIKRLVIGSGFNLRG